MSEIVTGNAHREARHYRGWFIGHFLSPAGDPRATADVEVKWGVHKAGEVKYTWAKSTAATTLSLLVRGRFRLSFPNHEFLLAEEGDYVIWSPQVFHKWQAEQDSVVLTVRWPSVPGDVVVAEGGPERGESG